MSDPVIEAATRVLNAGGWGNPSRLAASAACEAVLPVRKLHFPRKSVVDGHLFCDHCFDYGQISNTLWPCETALLVYSSEELFDE